MKLRIISLLLALLSLLALVSCSGELDPDDGWYPAGFQVASNENVDYDLFVPDTWTVDVSTGVITAYTKGGNISMMATTVEDGTSLADFWKKYETQFDPAFVDFKYVNQGQDILLDSGKVAAKKYIYTATVTGMKYKFYQVTAIINTTCYIFTFTAQEDSYDSLIGKVEETIGHISFDQADQSSADTSK